MANRENSGDEEKKDISVKGVSRDIYNRVLRLAKETGRTLGEVTNDAYRAFLSTAASAKQISRNFVEGATQSLPKYVENIKNLTIDGDDLKEIGHRVAFRNIDNLEFKNVNSEVFDDYVESITNVKNLKIPKSLSKARVLLKCNFVDSIETA